MRNPTHEWDFCAMCGPMVVCGNCGNNCCGGLMNPECPDKCKSAHKLMNANEPGPADMRAMLTKAQRACHDAVMDRAAVWCELGLLGDEDSNAAVDAIRNLRTRSP